MKQFKIEYTKTRNGAKRYVVFVEATDKNDAIGEFYSIYPKYHICPKGIIEM